MTKAQPVPQPPWVALTARPIPAFGLILVARRSDGRFAWAAGSTQAVSTATGTEAEEEIAHLAALEAFLDHPDHVGRQLWLHVEDTTGSRTIVSFLARHLPRMPVIVRPGISRDGDPAFSHVVDALRSILRVR